MSKVHALKTWPAPFNAVLNGSKRFEYRKDDRDFQVHDCLVLQEYLPDKDTFTSFALSMRVTHVLRGGQFGVPEGYCVMSIEPWNMRAALKKEVGDGQ